MSANKKKSAVPVSALRIYMRLLAYVKPYIFIFILSVIGMALYAYATVQFIDILEGLLHVLERHNPQDRIAIPLQVIGLTLLRSIGAFMGAYFLAKVSFGLVHRLRVDVFNHMTRLPKKVFDERNSNHLISVITYNINGVTAAATDAIKVGLREGSMVVGLFIKLILMNWQLTMVFLLVAPLIALLVTGVGKRLRRLSNKVQTSVGDIAQVSSEMINGVNVMRTFGGEAYEQQRFDEASKKNYLQNMKIIVTSAANTPLVQLLVAVAIALLIFVALSFDTSQDPVHFVAYMTAIGAILQPMRRLGEIAPMILKGVAAAESVFELLDEAPEPDSGKVVVERARGEVVFDQVSFGYGNREQLHLREVSFKANPGEVIALVGKTGSGKSTLVNLLPRFYEVEQGAIYLDGISLKDYQLASLRNQIAVVNQQITLFEGSIADNIAYGHRESVSLNAIKRAADLAYATEFINQLPHGFDTQIGEGGARLSGGQRQRLAIARAILKDAPILIFDEATSALDNESERYIQAAMEQVMKGRTTFVIAHRLSTIEHADRILVMEDGKMIEQGTHKALLQKNGSYAKLHAAQFHDDIAASE